MCMHLYQIFLPTIFLARPFTELANSSLPNDRYNIDSHDYSVRLRTAQRILKDGDKVIETSFVA